MPRADAALLPQCGSCMAWADSCCCWVCSNFGNNRLTGSIPSQISSLNQLTFLCARPCGRVAAVRLNPGPLEPRLHMRGHTDEHCLGQRCTARSRAVSGVGRQPPVVCSEFANNRLTGSIPLQLSSLNQLIVLYVHACGRGSTRVEWAAALRVEPAGVLRAAAQAVPWSTL